MRKRSSAFCEATSSVGRQIDGLAAHRIAAKLGAEIRKGRGKHKKVIVRVDGVYIGQFGLRKSKKTGHDYVADQIGVPMSAARSIAACTIDMDGYRTILRERGKLPIAN